MNGWLDNERTGFDAFGLPALAPVIYLGRRPLIIDNPPRAIIVSPPSYLSWQNSCCLRRFVHSGCHKQASIHGHFTVLSDIQRDNCLSTSHFETSINPRSLFRSINTALLRHAGGK
jgi:hypothetical protein